MAFKSTAMLSLVDAYELLKRLEQSVNRKTLNDRLKIKALPPPQITVTRAQ